MPHPAINTRVETTVPIQIRMKHFNGTSTSVKNATAWRSMDIREEPASTSNPIREDGTRAPAPYFIKTFTLKDRSATALTSRSTWGWYVSPVSSVDVWRTLVNRPNSAIFDTMHPSGNRTAVDARAKVSFLNKLADASGKDQFALGVATGEFRQTVGMARDLATGLFNGVLSVAKRFNKPPRRIADALTVYGEHGPKAALRQLGGTDTGLLEGIVEAWLVKQFGLDPLMGDLMSASTLLGANLGNDSYLNQFTLTLRGGADDTFKWWHPVTSVSNADCPLPNLVELQQVVRVGYSAVYKIPVRPTWPQRLGLYNPALVGAELTRWSWMADYVTNLTPWLRSLMAVDGCTFVEGSRSIVSKCDGLRGKSEDDNTTGISVVVSPVEDGSFLLNSVWFDRTVLQNGVFPPPHPSLNNRLDLNKLANSVAALTTLVGSRSRQGVPVIRY